MGRRYVDAARRICRIGQGHTGTRGQWDGKVDAGRDRDICHAATARNAPRNAAPRRRLGTQVGRLIWADADGEQDWHVPVAEGDRRARQTHLELSASATRNRRGRAKGTCCPGASGDACRRQVLEKPNGRMVIRRGVGSDDGMSTIDATGGSINASSKPQVLTRGDGIHWVGDQTRRQVSWERTVREAGCRVRLRVCNKQPGGVRVGVAAAAAAQAAAGQEARLQGHQLAAA